MPVAYCCHQFKNWWLQLFLPLAKMQTSPARADTNTPVFPTKTETQGYFLSFWGMLSHFVTVYACFGRPHRRLAASRKTIYHSAAEPSAWCQTGFFQFFQHQFLIYLHAQTGLLGQCYKAVHKFKILIVVNPSTELRSAQVILVSHH